jgi:hypothetical protein
MALVVQVQGKRLDPVTPTALFLPAVLNTVSQQHLITLRYPLSAAFSAEVKPQHRKWSVWRHEKIGCVHNRLVYTVYVCSGFMLVFSKLTTN